MLHSTGIYPTSVSEGKYLILSQLATRTPPEISCERHRRSDAREVGFPLQTTRSQGSNKHTHRDLKSYQDAIISFNIPALYERFEFIRQLGNVFLVRPEILKSYITENYLGRIDSSLLKPYIALRSDWGTFEKGFNSPDEIEVGAGQAIKDRFTRVSVMMKELEGLKMDSLGMGMPTVPASLVGTFSIPFRNVTA